MQLHKFTTHIIRNHLHISDVWHNILSKFTFKKKTTYLFLFQCDCAHSSCKREFTTKFALAKIYNKTNELYYSYWKWNQLQPTFFASCSFYWKKKWIFDVQFVEYNNLIRKKKTMKFFEFKFNHQLKIRFDECITMHQMNHLSVCLLCWLIKYLRWSNIPNKNKLIQREIETTTKHWD